MAAKTQLKERVKELATAQENAFKGILAGNADAKGTYANIQKTINDEGLNNKVTWYRNNKLNKA